MDFKTRVLTKLAQQAPGDESSIQGTQSSDVPELLQPDQEPSKGARGGHEAFSDAAEQKNQENRQGYLTKAFDQFQSGKRQTQAELSNTLDHYDTKAVSSKAMADKTAAIRTEAFVDELHKICG